MRLDIDEVYWIGSDDLNHTRFMYNVGGYESKNIKTGEVKVKEPFDVAVGYYPNIRQCITKVIELKLAESEEVVTLEGYLVRLEGLVKDLKGKITE
jgi:hypothetical protein